MVKDMSFTTISLVLDTWEHARLMPNFEEIVGVAALKELFDLNPRTKEVFGMERTYKVTAEEIKNSSYLVHAYSMIRMFDGAFQLLGPDSDTLREILQELGNRHVGYGVPAQFLPYMGQAIINVLKEALGKDVFTVDVEDAWIEVFDEFSGEMMRSILNGHAKIREASQREDPSMVQKRASIQSVSSTLSNTSISDDDSEEAPRAVKRVNKAVGKMKRQAIKSPSSKKKAMLFQ